MDKPASKGEFVHADVGTSAMERSAREIWARASGDLREQLPEGNYLAWFGAVSAVGVDNDTLTLQVASPFAKDWIEKRYLDPLQEAASGAAGKRLAVKLVAAATGRVEEPPETAGERDRSPVTPKAGRPDFHPKYSFESFVIGSSNRFAHAATLAVAEAPAKAYNPLFVYG